MYNIHNMYTYVQSILYYLLYIDIIFSLRCTYIFSLALADLLVIIISLPFTSIIYTVESWPWGVSICKISEMAKDISVGVSVFTLTALAADRFFAIVDPLKKFHTSGGGKKATRITVATAIGIWILAIICAIPGFYGSHIKNIWNDNETFCLEVCYPFPEKWLNGHYGQIMVVAKFLILYIIPLIIIFGFYVSMAASLIMSTKNVPGELQGMHRQIKARKKVAVTVLVFVAVFALCFAPFHIFMLLFYFKDDPDEFYNGFWHYFRIIGFCLCYMNSCANPIALYFVSGAFRKRFNRYLLCQERKRNRSNTSTGHQATSMSMISTKRQQSLHRKPTVSTRIHTNNCQETSITLLGNGQGDMNSII
ncbi:hypothetical protein ABEB36_008318 [Hypothenemus hampei]|uniref:G-protein coupled receptors family 1 profile domain-containing protein n=1 Tax=Hypothenemus hampei TaxID=57062 RepID=A0ABD1ELF4_HYPHA